ncbi:hypothetical protein GQ600_10055 [Phytophthora cactorum]|nr:hypothetical protein GQ600_10055 [Phytophthora cactorum]
MYWRVRYAGRW